MADSDPQQTLMVGSSLALSEDMNETPDVSDCLQEDDSKAVLAADILQRAFKEAEELSRTGISYSDEGSAVGEDRIPFPVDHSYITSVSCGNFPVSHSVSETYRTVDTVVNGDDTNSAVSCSDFQSASVDATTNIIVSSALTNPETGVEAVLLESAETELSLSGDLLPPEPVENVTPISGPEAMLTAVTSREDTDSLLAQPTGSPVLCTQNTPSALMTAITSVPASHNSGIAHLSLVPPKTTSAPLGSSENPIQIIQQGNTYHSTQVLTKQQLQQIAHVLQQQQVNKAMQNGGKAVLYDEVTNTRIIYRVIYPSELQGKNASCVRKGIGRGKNRSRRGWSKRPADDLNKGEGTLSKQEKEEKKKHRPRTRSGRISKPPSYMVKDYKRIHHLDFYEEPHDDSDGGYSDYQISDEERGQDGNASTLPPGVSTTKQRNFNCETCDKAYIGRGGLARHYRLNPTHGNLPEGEGVSTQDENSNSSLASSVLSNSGYPSQSTNTNVSSQKTGKEPETSSSASTISTKKKTQLKEVLSAYGDDELIETVMPRLAKALTLWKFLLLKHDTEKQHNVPDMFKDFEVLLYRMKKVAQNCLSPISSLETSRKEIVEIQNEEIAKIFCLNFGSYKVRNSEFISSFADCNPVQETSFECGTPDLLASPPLKRKRATPIETSAIQEVLSAAAASLPDQLLNDVVPEVSSIELSAMQSENLEAEIHHSDSSHLLNAPLSSTDFHSALNSRVLFDLSGSTAPSAHLQTAIDSLTTVTSSSLSSGSLSTVVTPESLKTHGLMSLRKSQGFGSPHTDVENIHLALQNATNNSGNANISSNTSNLETDQGNDQERAMFCSTGVHGISGGMNSVINNTIHLFESTGSTLEPGTVILGLKQLSTVPNLSTPSTGISLLKPNLNFTKPLDDSNGTSNVHSDFSMAQNVTNCLNPDNSVQSEIHNQSGVSECSGSICPSVADNVVEHSETNEHFSDLPEVAPVDESSEVLQTSIGSPSIIRQLVLPDGQVIGIWSTGGDQEDKDISDQLVQGFLPGNLIIVQNSDGSLQLPNDQDMTSESLQPFLLNQEGSRKDSS